MNDYIMNINEKLKHFLQRNVNICVNNEVYKQGKLILYTNGIFTINIHLKSSKKHKNEILKLPTPFGIEYCGDINTIYFDYRIQTFAHKDKQIIDLIGLVKPKTVSRLYDKILTIECIK